MFFYTLLRYFAILIQSYCLTVYIDSSNNNIFPSGSDINPFPNITIALNTYNISIDIIIRSDIQSSIPLYITQNITIYAENPITWVCMDNFTMLISNHSLVKIKGITFKKQLYRATYLKIFLAISQNSVVYIENCDFHMNLLYNLFYVMETSALIVNISEIYMVNNENIGVFAYIEDSYIEIDTAVFQEISNFTLIFARNSNIYIENSVIKNCDSISNGNELQGYIHTNYDIYIRNLSLYNFTLSHISLIFIEKNENIHLYIEDSYFYNISQDITTDTPLFLSSKFTVFLFFLENSLFFQNFAYDSFFNIENSSSNITISNVSYLSNFAGKSLIYISMSNSLVFQGIMIKNQTGGSCFKLISNIYKNFYNISITDSYSNFTAIGFQIIDIEEDMEIIKKLDIYIEMCYFANNYVFYDYDQNSSGIFYILTDFTVFIKNCYFFNNSINSTSNPNHKIGAPCLNSFSLYSNLSIESSIFGLNQAKFYSNCLFFAGNMLNISKSYFFSNNPIYDIMEILQYIQFFMTFTRKLESHVNANGGALLSQANTLIITNSFFYNNSNYRGGAIYIENDKNSLYVLMSYNVFQGNVGGTMGGGVNFASCSDLNGTLMDSIFIENDGKYGGGLATEYDHPDNLVLLKNVSFLLNTGEYASGFIAHHLRGVILVHNCLFFQNYAKHVPDRISPIAGGAFGVWGDRDSSSNLSNNLYIMNTADIHGGVFFVYGGNAYMKNESFLNNTSLVTGIFVLAFQSKLMMNDSIVMNSYSYYKGGGFTINEFSYLYIYNITIINSSSFEKAGVFDIYENAFVFAENITVRNCYSVRGAVLMLYEGYQTPVTFKNCVFYNNSAVNSLFDSSDSILIIEACKFENNSNSVFFLDKTVFSCIFSQIFYLICDSCLFLSGQASDISLLNTNFSNISTESSDNAFIMTTYSEIYMENIVINSIFQQKASFYAFFSNITISLSKFIDNYPSSLYLIGSNLSITSCVFETSQLNPSQSIIYLINPALTSIESSLFTHNSAENQGGGIYITSSKLYEIVDFQIIFQNSEFSSLLSKTQGGAIYIEDTSLEFFHCTFQYNTASEGGAIYYKASNEASIYTLSLKSSIFSNNTSFLGGGALYWLNKMPSIDLASMIFYNNKAKYGDNIASNPIRVQLKVYDINRTFLYYDSILNDSIGFEITGQKAGYLLNNSLIYSYLDYYNQIVMSIENTLETFDVITQKEYDYLVSNGVRQSENLDNDALKTYIIGANTFLIHQGVIIPENLKIYAKPASNVYFLVKPTIIMKFSKFLLIPSKIEYNVNSQYYLLLKMEILQCQIGEIIKNNSCLKCDPMQFSLNINDENCYKCPSNVHCNGGAELILDEGYWRSSVLSTNIISCQGSKANCLGGYDSICIDIFYGPLCRSCPNGFYNINNVFCLYCSDKIWNIFRVIGMMVILFILIIFLIKSTFDNNRVFDRLKGDNKVINEKDLMYLIDLQSFYIKIMVNWIQLTSLLYVIPLTWPDYLAQFMQFFSFFTSISTKFMAFECIFNQDDYGELKPYMKTFSVLLMPIVLIVMTLLYWKISQKLRRTMVISDKIYASIIGIYMMIQQNILNECLNSLTCVEIDGKSYLFNDPLYSCNSNTHFMMKSIIIWPLFMLWSFLLPLMILGYLFKNRWKLYEEHVFKKFNFFYIGYRRRFFYWDILIVLRKSFSIFIGLFSNNNINLQLMALLMIMSLYFKYLMAFKPFLSQNLNFLETIATAIGLIGIFLGILINLLETFEEKIAFYAILLISNVIFIGIWTMFFSMYLLGVYRKILSKRYPVVVARLKSLFMRYRFMVPNSYRNMETSEKKITSLKDSAGSWVWKSRFTNLIQTKKSKKCEEPVSTPVLKI